MVNKKDIAKKVIGKTPIGVKLKLAKVIIILCVVAFFIFPVIIMFLLAPDLNKGKDDVGCTVSGGNVSANGIDKFNENAKGGKLEGKGKEIQKIAEKNKVPVNIFMAIIASESQWGKGENATRQNNPLSVMGSKSIHDSTYPTIEDGLNAGAKNLYDVYISKGLDTPKKIGPKYAPVGASNDPNNMNARWIPTVEKIMKDLGGSEAKTSCSNGKGKSIKFNGKLPHWSNDDPGKGNLYTAGQCTWYAYGMHTVCVKKWVNLYRLIGMMHINGMIELKLRVIKLIKIRNLVHYLLLNKVQAVMMGIMVMWLLLLV